MIRRILLATILLICSLVPSTISAVISVDAPWVFTNFRMLPKQQFDTVFPKSGVLREMMREQFPVEGKSGRRYSFRHNFRNDPAYKKILEVYVDSVETDSLNRVRELIGDNIITGKIEPQWMRRYIDNYNLISNTIYTMMVSDPALIRYAYWRLPVPPKMPKEDYSFKAYLKNLKIPGLRIVDTVNTGAEPLHINWLHEFNIAMQLSQAYVSGNWYQGGNSYLAFLGNFLWDVQLNQVYHPKLMFQSTVSYKLAINSTPDDLYHKYSVSQDLFQYNLKAGYQAIHNWYYSFLLQFKTQFMRSYPANSETRTASFLSPGELNLGIGMTYTKEGKDQRWKISASIAPVSYNLKTCIDRYVDHAQFGIDSNKKLLNEYGSNAEVNFFWKIWDNITYTTRIFLFTDYTTFQGDWENTFNFQFNKFFSTQLYIHMRYDTAADSSISPKWHKWMMKEILSVGLSYTFNTK